MSYFKYAGDPRWITVRFDGVCQCGKPVRKGEKAFYYPKGKTLCGSGCGCAERAEADFNSCAQDEAFQNGGY